MNFDIKKSIMDYPIVAFDTETSGAYPLESEVIELGAVKCFQGKVIGQFQTLLKPKQPLRPDNIQIHGITNEMVKEAPLMSEQIVQFCEFISNSVLVAHHAPFDLGFVSLAIEKSNLKMPETFNLCSSLISRALLTTTNHKLQTLIKELNLDGGAAHRAYDDAFACYQVLMRSVEKLGDNQTLERILEIQKKDLNWLNYRIFSSGNQKIISLAKAIEDKKEIQIIYEGGQTKNKTRPILPLGIVRNPDGDYIQAMCGLDQQRKRFYVEKIKEVELY